MQLHSALFRLNGGCGYVLKPKWMRNLDEADGGGGGGDGSGGAVSVGVGVSGIGGLVASDGVPRALRLPVRMSLVRLTVVEGLLLPKPSDERHRLEPWMR